MNTSQPICLMYRRHQLTAIIHLDVDDRSSIVYISRRLVDLSK